MLSYEIEMYKTISEIINNLYTTKRYLRTVLESEKELKLTKSVGRPYQLNTEILTDMEQIKLMPQESYTELGPMFYLYNNPLFSENDLPEELADVHTILMDTSVLYADEDIVPLMAHMKVETDEEGMILDFRNSEMQDIYPLFAGHRHEEPWADEETDTTNIKNLFDYMVFEDYKDTKGAWITSEDDKFHIITKDNKHMEVDTADTDMLNSIKRELGYETIFVFQNHKGHAKSKGSKIVIY